MTLACFSINYLFGLVLCGQVRDFLVIAGIFGVIGLAVGGGVCGVLLSNIWLIVALTLGIGVAFAIIGVALKYILTMFEHRTWCY